MVRLSLSGTVSVLSSSEDEDEGHERGWSCDPAPVNITAFDSRMGATSTIPEDGTAKDFFCLFISDEIVEEIEVETNCYAGQCMSRKADPKWYETNLAEMQAFFGLHVLLGIHVVPDTSLYWSKDPALSVSFIKRVMTRDRFDKLTQYLHLNNNENKIPLPLRSCHESFPRRISAQTEFVHR